MSKRYLAMLLLLLWLPSAAIGQEYVVTEGQLQTLNSNLIQLRKLNSKLQQDLEMLHQRSEMQEDSLTTVCESFQKYATSQQTKLRQTKAERNILIVILSGLTVALVAK